MSALRISRPGEPVQLIDLGPAVGRIIHSRGPVYGSVAVAASPPKSHMTAEEAEKTRAAGRAYYERHREEVRRKQNARRDANRPHCNQWMPVIKQTCWRRPGHRDSCRSRDVMEDESKRRSSGRDRSEAIRHGMATRG